MSAEPPSARGRLAQLFAKVDAFFASAEAKLGGPDGITCARGCDDCCKRRFSVTSIEAEAIAAELAALPEARRDAIAARARTADTACPMLDADGACAVYAARPLICRTHGLPIRFEEPKGGRRLTVIDACPKNFVGRRLTDLPASVVLDQATLSTIVAALDAARAAERGLAPMPRVEIVSLAAT